MLLQRAVARGLVLPPGGFDLCLLDVELRLRHELLFEEHPNAREVGLGQVVGRLGARHVRHAVDVEMSLRPADPSRAWICATLASASVRLRLHLGRGDAARASAPARTCIPRSTGVATTRPAISAATSASSCAMSVPLARMKRVIGCSTAFAVSMRTGAAAFSTPAAFAAPPLPQPNEVTASATSQDVPAANCAD